jgi:hypothetical protein
MLDMYRDLIKSLSFYIKIEKDKILKKNKKWWINPNRFFISIKIFATFYY